ncbi:MAG TPA: hypothetical protein VG500_08620 [Gemmatimonadales bacterium]|jgi:hypothetical protein|nr:hypothetical protein [Gemmatimonadales bacterium]
MTLPLPSRFDERRLRLRLGIEPRDAVRQCRLTHPVDLRIDRERFTQPFTGPPLTDAEARWLQSLRAGGLRLADQLERVPRHASARHAIIADGTTPTRVDLRLLDQNRRYVPRRLRVPLAAGALDDIPIVRRSRQPWLWPGAAYPVLERATGLRGRVVVDVGGVLRPVRWARVRARRDVAGTQPIAWAHGDDRGEFLLILPPESLGPSAELATLSLVVEARGRLGLPPNPPPVPVREVDPTWDLPRETLAAPGTTPDPVAEGRAMPTDMNGAVIRVVTFRYSVILGDSEPPFVIS